MLASGYQVKYTLEGVPFYHNLDNGMISLEKPEVLMTPRELEEAKEQWTWLPHPTNYWQPAKIVKKEASGAVTCKTLDGQTVKVSHIKIMKNKLTNGISQKIPLWPLKRGALDRIESDLVALSDLNEGLILHNLRIRYENDDICTWVGSSRTVLISVNPFKELPIYGQDQIEKQRLGKSAAAIGQELMPHVFAIANDALDSLLFENRSQSILVSGESGAGKTHSTKSCLDFLAAVAASKKSDGRGSGRFEMVTMNAADPDQKVEQKIIRANPVLEAFGNAKTGRNNNSSRFGKFISVHIDRRSKLINGARITSFLLESSRVVIQSKGERSYHIFYELLADADVCEKYHLSGEAEDYTYLSQSGCSTIDDVDDEEEFAQVINALEQLGFESEEQEWLMRTTAAILHLGNVEFVEIKLENGQKGCKLDREEGSSNPQAAEMETKEEENQNDGDSDDENQGQDEKSNQSNAEKALEYASELLEIDPAALESVLTKRSITVRGEHSVIPLKKKQAIQARDSLAKAIYSRLFDWLVDRINESFGEATGKFIGILDIFGFEIFEHNSFEQLCINYANERLQLLFNKHTFSDEEELYEIEKINFKRITFQDNQPVLDLIDKKPDGILNLLDDECIVSGGTDARLMGRIESVHKDHKNFQSLGSGSRNKNVKRSDDEPLAFNIKHFAGTVTYDARGFMAKNSDTLFQDLYDICAKSEDDMTQVLFPELEENDRIKVISQSGKFRQQLVELMKVLDKTESRYIRCIKPNDAQGPNLFEGRKCLEQLKASGVFEAIEIRMTGYPFRLPHEDFARRYRIINKGYKYKNSSDDDHSIKQLCREIIDTSPQKFAGVQIGETRVMYRVEDHKLLELLRDLALAQTVPKIQAAWRRGLAHKVRSRLAKAEKALKDAMQGEPDIVALETAIEDTPDILGKIGAIFRINPPSLAAAKIRQAGLERWEDVEEKMEEFEDIKDPKSLDRSEAEKVLVEADALRKEEIPMTETQKELYDHIKELLEGETVDDLDDVASVALSTMEREKVEEVMEKASQFARSNETLDRVKDTAVRFKRLDEQASRGIELYDKTLLLKVQEEAQELHYTDGRIDEVEKLLKLDEKDFIEGEIVIAKKYRDRKRRKHRMLRLREVLLARNFEKQADFFSNDRFRSQMNLAAGGGCVAAFKSKASAMRGGGGRSATSQMSLQELDQQRTAAGSSKADPEDGGPAASETVPMSSNSRFSFTTERLGSSLLMMRKKDDIRAAIKCFENIKTYMGDGRRTSTAHRNAAALEVVKLGLEEQTVRDEIYAQIIQQLTGNNDRESIRRGIDLLCLVITTFPPSDESMENYVAVWCRLHLSTSLYSAMMSCLHDHRFSSDKDKLQLRLLAVCFYDLSAFSNDESRRKSLVDLNEEELNETVDGIYKAGAALQVLRERFQSFAAGSRFSLRFAYEKDPWEENPKFHKLKNTISGLTTSELVGLASNDDAESTSSFQQRNSGFKLRAKLDRLQAGVRNAFAGDSSPPVQRQNRTGSLVEVPPPSKGVGALLGRYFTR